MPASCVKHVTSYRILDVGKGELSIYHDGRQFAEQRLENTKSTITLDWKKFFDAKAQRRKEKPWKRGSAFAPEISRIHVVFVQSCIDTTFV